MTNNTLIGISMDTRLQKQPAGTYYFGKNGIQNLYKGTPQNEPGFTKYSAATPGKLIGIIVTDDKPILFSTTNLISYIGYFDPVADSYISILNDSNWTKKLNFKEENYIVGEFQRNFKNEIIVAFTDKKEEFRLLNCDNPQADSADDLQFFLRGTAPTIVASESTGGAVSRGAYFISLKYIKDDGSETPYTVTHGPIFISDSSSSTTTNKAISISLTDLDINFRQFVVAITSKINEKYEVLELDPIELTGSSATVIFTGSNTSTTIDLSEILVQTPVYKTVRTLGQLQDSLFLAGLEKYPEYNLQKYANLIQLKVRSELVDPRQKSVLQQKRSLMHGEVYALYVRYHRTFGGYTKAFTIPGQQPVSGDLLADTVAAANGVTDLVFRTSDTNRTVVGNTCSTGTWRNETERYPDTADYDSTSLGGLNYRNQLVLHHKMPSIAFCKTNFYQNNPEYGKSVLDILSLEVSNVIIPPELSRDIDGWEILIAKRSLDNSLVLGQSLIIAGAYSDENPSMASTGGNWTSNLTNSSVDTAGLHLNLSKFRLHPFDVLFNKPVIGPEYLAPQLRERVIGLNENYPTGGAIDRGRSIPESLTTPVTILADYTNRASEPVVVDNDQKQRPILHSKYLPNNLNLGSWNSTGIEGSFSVELANPLTLANDRLLVQANNTDSSMPNFEETLLCNLMAQRRSVYESFYSQQLVPSGQFIKLTPAPVVIYPGDVFISDYTYHTMGWYNGRNEVPTGITAGDLRKVATKVIRRFVCETVSNVNLRSETPGNIYSKWYPATTLSYGVTEIGGPNGIDDFDDGYIGSFLKGLDPNQFGYDKSLNALNELGDAFSFNPYLEDVNLFPNRIHRTGKLPRQGKARSWRTILPLDYYEMQKNRGSIVKVLGYGDRLLIHTTNSLFITESKARLDTGNLSIVLGTGDIFQFEPKEPLDTKLGYAGLQHELAGVQTPIGYIFPDVSQHQVFLYDGQLNLINPSINTFLKDYLSVTEVNPYIGNGITIGWDQEYKRMLLSVKNIHTPTAIKVFEDAPAFWASLQVGDLVLYKGKIVEYKGVNNTSYTCYSAPGITWQKSNPVCLQISSSNSGVKRWTKRLRLLNDTPDGFIEDNLRSAGVGPYFPDEFDTTACPLPSGLVTWIGANGYCELSAATCPMGYTLSDDKHTCLLGDTVEISTEQVNTGTLIYPTRCRLINGIPDGYCEDNAAGANHVTNVVNTNICPLPIAPELSGLKCGAEVKDTYNGSDAHTYSILTVGIPSGTVELAWESYERPNRFSIYKDGTEILTTGWKGYALYAGPWGSTLQSNQESGTLIYIVDPGHTYTIKVEAGLADSANVMSDTFAYKLNCY